MTSREAEQRLYAAMRHFEREYPRVAWTTHDEIVEANRALAEAWLRERDPKYAAR